MSWRNCATQELQNSERNYGFEKVQFRTASDSKIVYIKEFIGCTRFVLPHGDFSSALHPPMPPHAFPTENLVSNSSHSLKKTTSSSPDALEAPASNGASCGR